MISLHVTIYDLDDEAGPRFQVYSVVNDELTPVEVTEQYDISAMETDTGLTGFAVLKKEN